MAGTTTRHPLLAGEAVLVHRYELPAAHPLAPPVGHPSDYLVLGADDPELLGIRRLTVAARRNAVWPFVDNVTAVKVLVLILYVFGFVLQLVGAGGVIQDVRTSIGNMRQFKSDLSAADDTAQEHRQRIADIGNKPRGYGLEAAMSKWTDAVGEPAVEQFGPAAAEQRRALLKYVTAQNDMSKRRRWVPVWLLLGGLVVVFIGNVLSLCA